MYELFKLHCILHYNTHYTVLYQICILLFFFFSNFGSYEDGLNIAICYDLTKGWICFWKKKSGYIFHIISIDLTKRWAFLFWAKFIFEFYLSFYFLRPNKEMDLWKKKQFNLSFHLFRVQYELRQLLQPYGFKSVRLESRSDGEW